MIKFNKVMESIGRGISPETPGDASVMFVNISHGMYPNNLTFRMLAQDRMIKAFNISQIKYGWPVIQQ